MLRPHLNQGAFMADADVPVNILSDHKAGEHTVIVKSGAEWHPLCKIPFENGEVIALVRLLMTLMATVNHAAAGQSVDWAEVQRRCRAAVDGARSQAKAAP